MFRNAPGLTRTPGYGTITPMTFTTTSEYEVLASAVRAIANRCDGAMAEDGVGFSASDTTFGRSIAVLPLDEWDQDTAAAVYRLLAHYKSQLEEIGIPYSSIPAVAESRGARFGRSRAIRSASDALAVDSVARKSRLDLNGDTIVLHSPFHADLVKEVRGIAGRRWDSARGVNTFPTSSASDVRSLANKWHINIPLEIAELPDAPAVAIPAPELGLEIDGDLVIIRFTYDRALVDDVKRSVPAARWNVQKRVWATVTANLHQALAFAERHNLTIQPGLTEYLKAEQKRADDLRDASRATDADVNVPSAIPLLPYQRAGVAYALKTRRVMIADSMGLGKTIQALAAVVADNALPCVVVTTNTLKLNWVNEVRKFFPHLSTEVVSGTAPSDIPAADIVIANYDIIAQRADDLINLNPMSLIVDESHAIKNAKSKFVCPDCGAKVRINAKRCPECTAKFSAPVEKWTVRRGEGVMRISRAVSADGMVILLSGTPITNRPAELIPQLSAIGRLDEFGGRWRFQKRYCGDGSGATNLKELNEKMRGSFFIRRTQADVLDELPELRVAEQIMPVSAVSRNRYNEIEADVVHFLANRAKELAESAAAEKAVATLGLDIKDAAERESVRAAGRRAYTEKALRAEAAEHLVRISVLKNAVADLKYDSMIAWMEDFLSEGDEKLVVFAEHVEMVENVAVRFGDQAVKIRGGVSQEDRAAAVQRFQDDPTCRLFIGNMAAASEGLTLTAASNVVFLEQAWTPAMHAQCVARCYGRANDMHGAVAWYLLADNTIDMSINRMLQEKSVVVNAATDGIEVDQGGSVLGDLIVELANRQS